MTVKTACIALAAACAASAVGISTAHAQMAGPSSPTAGYYAPQPFPGFYTPPQYPGYYASPTSPGYYGSQPYQAGPYPGNTYPRWNAGYGSNTGPYAAPPYQGYAPSAPASATGPTELVTNGPQTSPGDRSSTWSPQRNVAESEHYDRLLETNRGFREARTRKECGPVTDPTLRANCEASFRQYEPVSGQSSPYGSSTGSRPNGSDYGR
jgi:hypothetical protein